MKIINYFICVMIALFSLSCTKNTSMHISGTFPAEYGAKSVTLITSVSSNKLVKVNVVDNQFTIDVDCKDMIPTRGKLAVSRKRGSVNISIIIYPCNAVAKVDSTGKHILIDDNGGYNYKILRAWKENSTYRQKFAEWKKYSDENGAEYFSKKTPFPRKMEIKGIYNGLRSKMIQAKQDFLMKNMTSKDKYLKALSLEEMGMTLDNEKYLSEVIKEVGETESLQALQKRRNFLLENSKRKSKLTLGSNFMNVVLPDLENKNHDLSVYITKHKYTILFFYGNYKNDYSKILSNLYSNYNTKDLGIYSVFESKSKNAAKYLKKAMNLYDMKDWCNVIESSFDKKSSFAYKYMMSTSPIAYIISNDGKIVASDVHRYMMEIKLNELLKK